MYDLSSCWSYGDNLTEIKTILVYVKFHLEKATQFANNNSIFRGPFLKD